MTVVTVERDGPVAILRLNRPERLNAISPEIVALLAYHVPRLLDDPGVRALVWTGTGRGFCAGGDIGALGEPDPPAIRAGLKGIHAWLARLVTAEKPVVTAVNGPAAGAGFGIALLGDIVYASTEARFTPGFPLVGVVPDYGLGWTLPRAVGGVRAREILLANRTVTAKEALAIGLVARLLEPEELLPAALETAHRLASGPYALGPTKTLLRQSPAQDIDTYLDAEAHAQATAFGSADFQEGVKAFMGKRRPVFQGR